MKSATMRKLGLYLIAIGFLSVATGAFIIYASLRDYTDCILAPSSQCVTTTPKLVKYLYGQQTGNSATLYGIAMILVGTVFYAFTDAVTTERDETIDTRAECESNSEESSE